MKKTIIIAIVLFVFSSININIASSWDDGATHRLLSEYATKSSVLNNAQNGYLKDIGFSNGLTERLKLGKEEHSILEWLQEGAELEDYASLQENTIGDARYQNHFHDPTKALWENAGLSDISSGMSSLLWAQNGTAQAGYSRGDQSWQKVRQVYYWGLTATTKELREVNLAQTFLGLGHQMHLLQDMAVPAHVRNDAHPLDATISRNPLTGNRYFETWTRDRFSSLNQLINDTPNPALPNVSFDDVYNGSEQLSPIANLYDNNEYQQTVPTISVTQGLAEYTNSNFFSDSTIFADEVYTQGDTHHFPYPKRTGTNLQDYIDQTGAFESIIAEDGTEDENVWIKKTFDGEVIEHFVRPGRLTRFYLDTVGEDNLFYASFYRDEVCHNDYAQKLIPRAVGYSAGLLNYFFRGDINLVPDSNGGGYVIANNSAEDMEGIFELYQEDSNGVRTQVWNSELILGPSGSVTDRSGNVSFPGTAGKYMLVFSGRLGNEYGVVVGRVVEILQGELAVFFVTNGKVSRCNTRYTDLMNEVPCQSLVIADNAYGGPSYSALPNYYSRTTQKSFLHKGNKIYLIKHLPGIGKAKIYLFDPYIKKTYMLSDDYFSDEDFMNASDQYIFTSKDYPDDIQVFSYEGNGVIIDKGTYHPGNWTSYVSPEGDVYKTTYSVTPIETGMPPRVEGYISETKLYIYNIFTEALTEVIYPEHLSKSETYWGGSNYHSSWDMMYKSATDGIRAEFQPYISSKATQYNGQNGSETTYDFTVFGDNYHSINSCDNGGNCSFTGDRVATIGTRQIYSTLYNSSQGNRSGLLIPHNADIPFTQYERNVTSTASPQGLIRRVSKLSTPYEVFESDAEYLEMGDFSVFIEDIIDRNLLISGFTTKHTNQADPANYYYELVLYNQNGERIDQKLMNVLGITDPNALRGMKLLD